VSFRIIKPKTASTVLDVRDYGAVGDGVADDAFAIQTALDTANSVGGGTVFVPEGTFIIGTQLSIYSNTSLIGVNPGASIIKATGSMTWTSGGLIKVGTTGQSNITIRDLTIDGNRVNNFDATYNFERQLIAILDAHDFTVRDCLVKNSTGIGIYGTSGMRSKVIGNRFEEIDIAPVYFYDYQVPLLVSASADGIIDTASAHPYAAGDEVKFDVITSGGSSLLTQRRYYVISDNLTSTTFQISNSPGGSAMGFGSNITGAAVTLATSAHADDIIDTSGAHSFSAWDRVIFTSLTGGTGLSVNTVYWVTATNLAATTFQVASAYAGAAIGFSADITAGTVMKLPGLMSRHAHGTIIEGNDIRAYGRHAIAVTGHRKAQVKNNTIVGNVATGMTCSFSGTTVTKTAGTRDFSSLRPGNFLVHDAGGSFTESGIISIESATSCTIGATVGTYTGVTVAGGSGDVVSFEGCHESDIQGNIVDAGVSIGISVWSFWTGSSRNVNVDGNTVREIGGPGIALSGAFSWAPTRGVRVVNNTINNVGTRGDAGSSAIAATVNHGITLDSAYLSKVHIDGNIVDDDQGSPTTAYWLYCSSSVPVAAASAGRNLTRQTVNPGIGPAGSFSGATWTGNGLSITLTDWGTSPSISNVVQSGNTLRFRVTTGTTASAGPYISLSMKVGSPENGMPLAAWMVSPSGSTQVLNTYDPTAQLAATTAALFYSGTPGNGSIWDVVVVW